MCIHQTVCRPIGNRRIIFIHLISDTVVALWQSISYFACFHFEKHFWRAVKHTFIQFGCFTSILHFIYADLWISCSGSFKLLWLLYALCHTNATIKMFVSDLSAAVYSKCCHPNEMVIVMLDEWEMGTSKSIQWELKAWKLIVVIVPNVNELLLSFDQPWFDFSSNQFFDISINHIIIYFQF